VVSWISSPKARRQFAFWLFWTALVVQIPIAVVAVRRSQRPHADLDNYYNIATRPGRPYRDFAVEFPVGTVAAFRTLGSISGNRAQFGVNIVLINIVANLVIAGVLVWGWDLATAASYAAVVTPIIDLFFLRIDLWSTAFATIAVAAWHRRRLLVAGTNIAVGALLKLWPLAFVPLLFVHVRPQSKITGVVASLGAGLAALAGWLWIAGVSGVYQVLSFRGATGWQIESTVGATWMLIDQSSMRVEAGAWRIGATNGPISVLFFVLAIGPCLWIVWRGARTGHLGTGWIGGISALLVLSPLLSPQFAAWLAPATGVAWTEGDRRTAILNALGIFLSNLVWKSANPLVHGGGRALATLIARNVLLAVIAVDAARLVARAPVLPNRAAALRC
jgi:hypothetical protein